MQNCDATINFCLVFNDMFDALNAKIPCQGVHLKSKNYEVDYKCWVFIVYLLGFLCALYNNLLCTY